MMNDYISIFENLRYHPEGEVVEFKEAKESYSVEELGKYFSALCNEPNLRGIDLAWLIVGATEKKREIVGTQFIDAMYALNK